MKKFILFIFISFLFGGKVFAYNFKETINNYSLNNKGVVSSIYILNRCSGLLTYTSSMMLKEPNGKELAMKYIDLSTVSLDTA